MDDIKINCELDTEFLSITSMKFKVHSVKGPKSSLSWMPYGLNTTATFLNFQLLY